LFNHLSASASRLGSPTLSTSKASVGLSAGEVWTWVFVLVGLSFYANILRAGPEGSPQLDPGSVISRIIDGGAFNIAAWAMLLLRARRVVPIGIASQRMLLGTIAIGAACCVPLRQATIVALAGSIVLLCTEPRLTRSGREAVSLLIGLVASMVWTSAYVLPLHAMAGILDAHIVAIMLQALGDSVSVHRNIIINHSGNIEIAVLPFCCSSFQLAAVSLAYLVTKLYLESPLRRPDLLWLGASLAASVILTELRLSILTTQNPEYLWWHDGPGVSIYSVSAVLLAVVFPWLATWRDDGTKGRVEGSATA